LDNLGKDERLDRTSEIDDLDEKDAYMKKTITIALLFLAIVATTMEAGCHMEEKFGTLSNERLIKMMKEHLVEKYGPIEYDVLRLERYGFDYNADRLFCGMVDNHLRHFEVTRYRDDDGKLKLMDNYYSIFIHEDFENYLKPELESEFGQVMVRMFLPSHFPEECDRNTKLTDVVDSKSANACRFMVFVNGGRYGSALEFKEAAIAFLHGREERGRTNAFYFYLVKEEFFADLTYENASTDYVDETKTKIVMSLNAIFTVDNEWHFYEHYQPLPD
jgi:hypothetical protein